MPLSVREWVPERPALRNQGGLCGPLPSRACPVLIGGPCTFPPTVWACCHQDLRHHGVCGSRPKGAWGVARGRLRWVPFCLHPLHEIPSVPWLPDARHAHLPCAREKGTQFGEQLAIYITVPTPPLLLAVLRQSPPLTPDAHPPFPARHPRSLCCHWPLLPNPSTQATCLPRCLALCAVCVLCAAGPHQFGQILVGAMAAGLGARDLGASAFWVKPSPSWGWSIQESCSSLDWLHLASVLKLAGPCWPMPAHRGPVVGVPAGASILGAHRLMPWRPGCCLFPTQHPAPGPF